MSGLRWLLTQSVSVLAPGTKTSRGGSSVDDWSAPVTVGTYPAAVQGLTGFEETDSGRSGAVAKLRVYLPPTVVVQPDNRLAWGSRTLLVVGVPRVVYSLTTGAAHHLEIDCREGEG